MTGALIILAVTVAVGFVLWLASRLGYGARRQADGAEPTPGADAPQGADGGGVCCGRHAVCERFSPLPPDTPEYFDDEELDRFAAREPDSYTSEEIEEFRGVLYTLLPSDVYPWGVALTRRDIALPVQLRDEWMMLCTDAPADSNASHV